MVVKVRVIIYWELVWLVRLTCRRIVRSQTTTDPPHNVSFCKDRSDDWGKIPECPVPQFAGGFPQVCLVFYLKLRKYYNWESNKSFIGEFSAISKQLSLLLFRRGCGWLGQWLFISVSDWCVSSATCRESRTGRCVWSWFTSSLSFWVARF